MQVRSGHTQARALGFDNVLGFNRCPSAQSALGLVLLDHFYERADVDERADVELGSLQAVQPFPVDD